MRIRYFIFTLAMLELLFFGVPNSYAQTVDKYGGATALACSNGPAPHFYTEKIGDRWWVCDPAGHGFFLKGVVGVSYSGASVDRIKSKYGSTSNPYVVSSAKVPDTVWYYNYFIEQINRLNAWGFNWLADGATAGLWPTNTNSDWNTPDHTIPDQLKMPFDLGMNTTRYAMLPSAPCSSSLPLKDMIKGVGAAFTAYPYDAGDYFDPNFATCANALWNITNTENELAAALGQSPNAPHGDYLIYLYLDEGDQLGGLLGAGPDFPTVDINNGTPGGGTTAYHAGWVALATKPSQSSATVLDHSFTYSNEEVYTKVALANLMANRYLCTGSGTPLACCTGNKTGTCSMDPNAGVGTAVTGSNITTATNALNRAWGSTYTTLSTSDSHCTSNLASCLQGGTYASWGTGTGLLDENGSHSWMGNDITLAGETAAMQADMSTFLLSYVKQYFSVVVGAIHANAPGVLTQMSMGGYGSPPRKEVLEATSQYLDLPQLDELPPYCPTCTDIQQRNDFVARYVGDKPWMEWEGFYANPNSAQYQNVRTDNMAITQEGRGGAYQAMVSDLINAEDSGGTYHVVGFYWWAMYDGQGLNWGLCTPSDNAYDGKSATINGINGNRGKDQWGYPTGGEGKNYGDFISSVKAANDSAVERTLTRRKALTP